MKSKLLTDVELRARWSPNRAPVYYVEEGTILTPSAQDFIREHHITLQTVSHQEASRTMTVVPIPMADGGARFVDARTGAPMKEKPETMTHLRGNLLVPKTHPQIEFRGKLDSLMGLILEIQCTAEEAQEPQIAADLEELLGYVREILAAEVKDEPLREISLLGLDSEQIRYRSQHVKETFGIDHPVPNHRMGRLCVALNYLRTQVRETELAAARAFWEQGGGCRRADIVEGLNRLSSCVYIIFCRKLSSRSGGGHGK